MAGVSIEVVITPSPDDEKAMKLVSHWILVTELQDYLDKFEEKIKFIVCFDSTRMILVIDES